MKLKSITIMLSLTLLSLNAFSSQVGSSGLLTHTRQSGIELFQVSPRDFASQNKGEKIKTMTFSVDGEVKRELSTRPWEFPLSTLSGRPNVVSVEIISQSGQRYEDYIMMEAPEYGEQVNVSSNYRCMELPNDKSPYDCMREHFQRSQKLQSAFRSFDEAVSQLTSKDLKALAYDKTTKRLIQARQSVPFFVGEWTCIGSLKNSSANRTSTLALTYDPHFRFSNININGEEDLVPYQDEMVSKEALNTSKFETIQHIWPQQRDVGVTLMFLEARWMIRAYEGEKRLFIEHSYNPDALTASFPPISRELMQAYNQKPYEGSPSIRPIESYREALSYTECIPTSEFEKLKLKFD
jgi:hypothetical protein